MRSPVLLVEDDEILGRLLVRAMSGAGFETVWHRDTSGVEAHIAATPDIVVVMDDELPGERGLEALKRLRGRWNAAEIPIIMCTSRTAPGDIIAALAAGANDFVSKPVIPEVLVARISTQIALARLTSEQAREARQAAVAAMVVTYNHEINNALMVATGWFRQYRQVGGDQAADHVDHALVRIKNVVQKITDLQNSDVEFTRYLGDRQMIKLAK